MTPELCLGTAQFGLSYGITNSSGQVSEYEVGQLLVQANDAGFRYLDTAQAYGNAEEIIGRHLLPSHDYALISKLPAQSKSKFSALDVNIWEDAFFESCRRLRVGHLNSLLLHTSSDLSKPGGQYLEDWLLSLRTRGLVQRIGVSIYDVEDLEVVNPALLDLVQLPISLFDQRLIQDGTVRRLRDRGTAVHARSLYLQGLLLTPSTRWPTWFSPEVLAHHQALEALAEKRNCRLIDLAIGFARDQVDLEAVVLGLCSVEELADLQAAWTATSPWKGGEWQAWALQDPRILDPRRWPH